MANPYYLGRDSVEVLGGAQRFFYAIRRNMDGELFIIRSDQLKDATDVIEINMPGAESGTFEDFEAGVDYFEGITADHEVVFDNLKYPQYRWDDRSLFYYIDDEGRLTIRINKGYTYPDGISGP